MNFALAHGVLMLGSILHHVPTAQPQGCLLIDGKVQVKFGSGTPNESLRWLDLSRARYRWL